MSYLERMMKFFGTNDEPKNTEANDPWWLFPKEEMPGEELSQEDQLNMTGLMWDDMHFDADHDFDGDGFEGEWED